MTQDQQYQQKLASCNQCGATLLYKTELKEGKCQTCLTSSVWKKHSCFDCLNNIPPQNIANCVNCLAERQPELFPRHIITETLPLLFLEE